MLVDVVVLLVAVVVVSVVAVVGGRVVPVVEDVVRDELVAPLVALVVTGSVLEGVVTPVDVTVVSLTPPSPAHTMKYAAAPPPPSTMMTAAMMPASSARERRWAGCAAAGGGGGVITSAGKGGGGTLRAGAGGTTRIGEKIGGGGTGVTGTADVSTAGGVTATTSGVTEADIGVPQPVQKRLSTLRARPQAGHIQPESGVVGGAAWPVSAVPHVSQNLCPGLAGVPQFGHVTGAASIGPSGRGSVGSFMAASTEVEWT
jgi:hypothetical protein